MEDQDHSARDIALFLVNWNYEADKIIGRVYPSGHFRR